MTTAQDVLDAMGHVRDCTGDKMGGLLPDEVAEVGFAMLPEQAEALLTTIHRRYPHLFESPDGKPITPSAPPTSDVPSSDGQEGAAADAIRDAENALSDQNSATARLDLQVVTAILNAHRKTREGARALDDLKKEVEEAVHARTDLDTPAGARDFQQFLIGKTKQIEDVIRRTSLDDTSYAALMGALKTLYNAPKNDQGASSGPSAGRVGPPPQTDDRELLMPPTAAVDQYLDPLAPDDPAPPAGTAPAPAAPMVPTMPSIPNLGGGGVPGLGSMPTGGLPLSGLLQDLGRHRSPRRLDDAALYPEDLDDEQAPDDNETDDDAESPAAEPESATGAGPTTVTLPNGETVTAASPQLAAVIKAATGGTPIAEAFLRQGITIPPPGSAVGSPVELTRVAPGDIGMFTDRHALAIGNEEALYNAQIQPISTVTGPSFLGWEHPPAPGATTTDTRTDTPTPTRPAAAAGTPR